MSGKQRRESPVKRVNGKSTVSWMARYTDRKGRRRSAGTFKLKREAQVAIDAAYGLPEQRGTVGEYFATWLDRHPRSPQTNDTNARRIRALLDIEVEGLPLRDWPYAELRRRHVLVMVDHMLRVQRRAARGVRGVLSVFSAMSEDAITDEVADLNAARGVRVRGNDPRVRKHSRAIRVWSWEQMHEFARAAGEARTGKEGPCPMDEWRMVYAEPMVRTFSDTGARMAEVLAIERTHLEDGVFRMQQTALEGVVQGGTKPDHLRGETSGERVAPCPPTLAAMIAGLPPRLDTRLLFPTPTGRLWRRRNFYRDVWYPAQEQSGMDMRPHEMRHSWITHLRAAGIDEVDLADMAGHALATMLATYTHPLRASFDAVREAIG
jgi:integrase